MITTAVIAAAGKGTRMLDYAKDIPKHIIAINGKPFLYYLLHNLKDAGITNTIIVVGNLKEKIEEYVDTIRDDFNITLVDQFKMLGTEKYGTICPIEASKQAIDGKPFISVFGDNVYATHDIKKVCVDDSLNCVGGLVNPNPERYSVLIEQDGFLKRIIEKPTKEEAGNFLVNPGLYAFTQEIFSILPQIKKSIRGEYELPDAVSILADKSSVKVIPMNGPWIDLGRPEDIATASEILATI